MGDRPEYCPVCKRWVPCLCRHANARHLPWFVDFSTACSQCKVQCITRRRLRLHIEECHPGHTGLLPVEEWIPLLNASCFSRLARALGVPGFAGITGYVRHHHLGLATPASLREEEKEHFRLSWCGKDGPFMPHQPRDLRDCAHWKIMLRLISKVGNSCLQTLVKPVNDYDGRIFLAMPAARKRESREISRLRRRVRQLQGQLHNQRLKPQRPKGLDCDGGR